MRKKIFILSQYLLPQHGLSRLMHYLCEATTTKLKNSLIKRFMRVYTINMAEALQEDPYSYPSFNAFFTRQLKPDARPIAAGINQICSPADGLISQIGPIQKGRMIQAKGFDFTVTELIGGDTTLAQRFEQGLFTTIYLAPKDYHRVHLPLAGTLKQMIVIPGKLFSVNTVTAENVPRLFARNERVAFVFETDNGPMIVVMVGAFFVGSIATAWAGTITPNSSKEATVKQYDNNEIRLEKGAELGYFKLGSTAIVLLPADVAHWLPEFKTGDKVQVGQAIGRLD